MGNYRRVRIAGGCYFFTLVTQGRRPILADADALRALRSALVRVRARRAFRLDAIVVLPDHLHMLVTLPSGDSDYATRIQGVKALFSRLLPRSYRNGAPPPSSSELAKREAGIWQRRYWEHAIRGEEDFIHHLEYIFINPVKHGLVHRVADWRLSSFHRYVAMGKYPLDWASDHPMICDDSTCYGE